MSKELKRPNTDDYHYRLCKGQCENKKTGVSYLEDCEKYIDQLESKLKAVEDKNKRCFCGAKFDGIECNNCGFDATESDIY